MPYLFGGLVILNALTLGYYLFLQPPVTTKSVQIAQSELINPLVFTNSAEHIPPPIGDKNQ